VTEERVNIPEPSPEIGAGFLAELWRGDSPLPRIQGYQLLLYYLRKGLDNLIALPMSNAITVITMAISIFVFAGFLLILQNVDRIVSGAGTTLYVTAFIKDDAPDKEVMTFLQELEKSPGVKSARYLSKGDALNMFRQELGARGSFLRGLDDSNPLPASFELILQPDELNIGGTGKAIDKLRNNGLLEEVIYGSEWVEKSQSVIQIFRYLGYVSLFVVLAVIIFLIANTIKLVIYSLRDEIAIMQLVGATDGFIRIPFLLSGVFQGLIGSVVGLLLLRAAFAFVNQEVANSTLLGAALPELFFLSLPLVFLIAALGVVIGSVGSLFALGRFLNV